MTKIYLINLGKVKSRLNTKITKQSSLQCFVRMLKTSNSGGTSEVGFQKSNKYIKKTVHKTYAQKSTCASQKGFLWSFSKFYIFLNNNIVMKI